MDWEVVNGITGLISAVSAIVSIGYFASKRRSVQQAKDRLLLPTEKLLSFVIACSGWALCCLSVLWIVEPYGGRPSSREYQQFFGIILAFPAFVTFIFALRLLRGSQYGNSSEREPNARPDHR